MDNKDESALSAAKQPPAEASAKSEVDQDKHEMDSDGGEGDDDDLGSDAGKQEAKAASLGEGQDMEDIARRRFLKLFAKSINQQA